MYALCSVSLYACDLHVVLCSHARPRLRLYFVEQPARELEAEERRAVREGGPTSHRISALECFLFTPHGDADAPNKAVQEPVRGAPCACCGIRVEAVGLDARRGR